MSNRRRSNALAAVLAAWCVLVGSVAAPVQGSLAQQAQPVMARSATVVSPAEQAARDAERVRILESELAKEQQRADEAARTRAQRLAAGDAAAAVQAEEARARSLENVAALRRELATALPPDRSVRSAAATPPVLQVRQTADRTAPWWDVYARRRPGPAPDSFTASPVRP